MVVTFISIAIGLVVFLFVISCLLGEALILSREELSPYECGFEHNALSRVPFSLRYFFLTLVFLLFDLEVVLILFFPYYIFSSSIFIRVFFLLAFLLLLFLSLLYE